MKRKKRRISNLILVLVFLAGLSLLLYPTVSNFLNTRNQTRTIADYQNELSNGDLESHARLLAHAAVYNEALIGRENPYTLTPELQSRYDALLDITGTGVMGYVEIPCIDCSLPIYHGTSDAVLQTAVGHLEWSSLPVGGENTHCVVSGHRGLPSAELMTNIDRLRVGDRFYIHVLDQVLEYQVDQIKVVLPDDMEYLQIEPYQDLVTLVTCTPYGINSHRLLVRGTRIIDGKTMGGQLLLANELEEVSLIYVLPAALVLVVLAFTLLTGARQLFRRKPKEK